MGVIIRVKCAHRVLVVKKNLKNYELGDFNTFKKDLAKDFAKEVKNKKYQLSEKSKNTWIGKTASANKRTTLENLPHIQQFKNVDLVSPYYHTLFYDNYLKNKLLVYISNMQIIVFFLQIFQNSEHYVTIKIFFEI